MEMKIIYRSRTNWAVAIALCLLAVILAPAALAQDVAGLQGGSVLAEDAAEE